MNRTARLLCAWSGPVLTVLFALGWVALAQFIPPPDPTDSAAEITAFYRDNLDGIRIGLFLTMVSMALIAPWGVGLAMELRKSERGLPVLTYTQVACVAIGTTIAVLFTVLYGVTAFRPGEIPPEITRTLNDISWFLFLFDWSPFSVWCVAVALTILLDKSEQPAFPRWSAYLSLWTGFLFIPAGLILYFKTGAFAYNGLLAMYIPLLVFFVWLVTMTVLMLKNIKRETVAEAIAQPGDGRIADVLSPEPTAANPG